MKYIAGPEGQAVYTKEIDAPADAECAAHGRVALRSAQHEHFLDLLPTAKSRPPLQWAPPTGTRSRAPRVRSSSTPRSRMAALQEVEDAVQPQLDAVGC